MNTLFILIFLLSIPSLIIGLIKPSIFKLHTRKSVGFSLGGIMIASFILFGITSTSSPEVVPIAVQNNNIATSTNTSVREIATSTEPVGATTKTTPITQTAVLLPKTNPQYAYYSVTDVVDGDTVKININGTIETLRLIGLDTPETVDPRKEVQCFGKEASNKGKELLTGKKVRLEKDPTQGDKDKYGRTLAYIYTESGIFYNKYMIEQGYAHEYTYNSAYKYQAEFKQAQRNAEANKVGLWSPSTCNGITTSALKTSPAVTQSSGKFYTSSYSTSKYFYPETCDGWKGLNSKYLKSFSSLPELLAQYPSRVKSPECQ
jgi:micrococcal nuclease